MLRGLILLASANSAKRSHRSPVSGVVFRTAQLGQSRHFGTEHGNGLHELVNPHPEPVALGFGSFPPDARDLYISPRALAMAQEAEDPAAYSGNRARNDDVRGH